MMTREEAFKIAVSILPQLDEHDKKAGQFWDKKFLKSCKEKWDTGSHKWSEEENWVFDNMGDSIHIFEDGSFQHIFLPSPF